MADEPEDCCFDDWVGYWSKRVRRKPTAAAVTVCLLEALEEAGVRDRTVLDIGCGIGDVASGTVQRGAARAFGVELSPRAVAEATRLAAECGVGERVTFTIGDGAKVDLPRADVVVLNRVFCCYPDIDALLGRSLAAAEHVYAFTAPPSNGVLGALARLQARWANVWYRLRDARYHGFRVFVHDLDAVDARVRAAGFSPLRRERRRLAWQLAVYAR
ncbi:MAG: class I SAM-dependent methyltransferase [Actinomycetota bacterium]